jgi:hypothetical protein
LAQHHDRHAERQAQDAGGDVDRHHAAGSKGLDDGFRGIGERRMDVDLGIAVALERKQHQRHAARSQLGHQRR